MKAARPARAGETRTVALLAAANSSAPGLRPGNNGSWYQDVPLVEITAAGQPAARDHRRPGAASASTTAPTSSAPPTAPSRGSRSTNSEIVFVGYGINAPERGWNDYDGLDVRGKTVVILVNDPDWQTQGLTGPFNGRAMTYYGRWTYKFEEAARQGAAAAFIVHDTAPASYGWNVVENSWTGPAALHADRRTTAPTRPR